MIAKHELDDALMLLTARILPDRIFGNDRAKASVGARWSRAQLILGELSQVISLAEGDPVVPENIVSRCHVKIEVGQREPGQVFLGSQTHNACGRFQLDLARIGVAESISLKFLDKL